MHVMSGYLFTLYRFKRSGSNMKSKFFTLNTFIINCLKYIFSKMQTGGWGSNTALYL